MLHVAARYIHEVTYLLHFIRYMILYNFKLSYNITKQFSFALIRFKKLKIKITTLGLKLLSNFDLSRTFSLQH